MELVQWAEGTASHEGHGQTLQLLSGRLVRAQDARHMCNQEAVRFRNSVQGKTCKHGRQPGFGSASGK